MTTDQQVESVARAIYAAASGAERPCFGREPESVKRFYFQQARAAISAMPKDSGADVRRAAAAEAALCIAWLRTRGKQQADAAGFEKCADALEALIDVLAYSGWRPLNPNIDAAYNAVRHSGDPDIEALQSRMSFSEIRALVGFVGRVLIASCPPPPEGEGNA